MKRVAVCAEQEYARRLSDYLIRNMSEQVRIYSFTSPELLMNYTEEPDLYLLGEEFCHVLKDMDDPIPEKKLIVLTEKEVDDCFCKWDSPRKLLLLMKQRFSVEERLDTAYKGRQITAIYDPCPGTDLREWILPRMKPGDLFLGFEDMHGPLQRDSDMGGLCYYIRLHEPEIYDSLHRVVRQKDGKFYVDSPAWFFDYLGLTEEDYRWFYGGLRDLVGYRDIYIGLGSRAISSLSYFGLFDRLLLLNHQRDREVDDFCQRLSRTLVEEEVLSQEAIRYLREAGREGEPS